MGMGSSGMVGAADTSVIAARTVEVRQAKANFIVAKAKSNEKKRKLEKKPGTGSRRRTERRTEEESELGNETTRRLGTLYPRAQSAMHPWQGVRSTDAVSVPRHDRFQRDRHRRMKSEQCSLAMTGHRSAACQH